MSSRSRGIWIIPRQDQSKKGVIDIPWNEKAKGETLILRVRNELDDYPESKKLNLSSAS